MHQTLDVPFQELFDAALEKGSKPFLLGLLGGTFDPPHVGHIAAARAARDQLGLDAVLLIPAGTPVYKLDQYVTPAEDRLAMTHRAAEGEEGFLVSSLEVERLGNTYTSTTLEELKGILPSNVELVFIAGVDAALTIPKWKNSDVIARLARIAVVTRPGYPLGVDDDRYGQLMSRFQVSVVEAETPDVASSRIRESLERGLPLDGLVPAGVADYIAQHGLYQRRDASCGDDR